MENFKLYLFIFCIMVICFTTMIILIKISPIYDENEQPIKDKKDNKDKIYFTDLL
jgi:hypothetical protein